MSITNTIHLLQQVILDENCGRMNKSTVKGFLGELIVKEKLEEAGFEVEHQGNQSGYDLLVWFQDKEIKGDVKTSTLKDDLYCGRNHWGWALKHSNKKKPISATHYICIGLDDDLEAKRFFIIPASLVSKFPKGIGQFSKVEHALCAFQKQFTPENPYSKKSKYIN